MQCSYLHLSDIAVKVGDVVNASQKLGVSGNTGTRTTGGFQITVVLLLPFVYLGELCGDGILQQGSLGPVSYTHLDVYKRQGIRHADWM